MKAPSATGTQRVLALILDAARRGSEVPPNAAIAEALGVPTSVVHSALHNLVAAGRIIIHRSGTHLSGRRRFETGGGCSAWSPRASKRAEARPRSVPDIAVAEPERPDQPIRPRRLPRCPFCELPAGHHLCRHGWNGITTRAQRRMIATAAGLYRKSKGAGA